MTAEGESVARGTPVIRTRGITMEYPRVRALDDLDLDVGDGVTGLVGANGAGKSTLIKVLLGLLPPTSGDAQVLGHDVRSEGASIRARVGYMPEHDCLPADVSASEFVVHMGRMSGLPHTVARERAADVLRHVGLAEERYRVMGGYSTGMKQRAKLGELERVSDHVIVLDGGRLLRSSATSEFTEATGTLLVEVLGTATDRDRLGQALAERGLQCHPVDNAVEVVPPPSGEVGGVDIRDLVRDTVIDLDLGLVRIQEGRHRIQDVFAIREEVPQP